MNRHDFKAQQVLARESRDSQALEPKTIAKHNGVGSKIGDPLRKITPFQRRVAKLVSGGMDITGIAQVLGCSQSTVIKAREHPVCERYIRALDMLEIDTIKPDIEKLNDRIKVSAVTAFDNQELLMGNMFERQADLKAARLAHDINRDMMDRAGAAAPKKIDTRSITANVDLDSEHIAGVFKELMQIDGIQRG